MANIDDIVKEILDDGEKKIFIICGSNQDTNIESLKDALRAATLIPKTFIKNGAYPSKFSPDIINANYLIVDEPLDIKVMNSLTFWKMKSIIHGEFSSNRGVLLGAKKLIIVSSSYSQESIFASDAGLKKRCKFISFK